MPFQPLSTTELAAPDWPNHSKSQGIQLELPNSPPLPFCPQTIEGPPIQEPITPHVRRTDLQTRWQNPSSIRENTIHHQLILSVEY